MLSIPPGTVRQARAVLRKVGDVEFREKPSAVLIRADNSGLRLQARAGTVGAEYFVPGSFPVASACIPFAALADFERASDSVTLTEQPRDEVLVEWIDAGVPRRKTYSVPTKPRAWLDIPSDLEKVANDRFIAVINTAMSAAASTSFKFSLSNVLLRGAAGEAVGSDGKQLLVQRGGHFPWREDVLVTRTRFLETKVFAAAESAEVGRTDDHVVIRAGCWTAWLDVNKTGRFPKYESIISGDSRDATRLILSEGDAAFLNISLPRLPGNDADDAPVTLHLNGAAVVRVKENAGPTTELILRDSRVRGREVKVHTNRSFLRRAVELGVREFRCLNGDTPIVAETPERTYVWMPLPSKFAFNHTADCVRIESPGGETSAATVPIRQPQPKKEVPMTDKSQTNHDDEQVETPEDAVLDPIQEAEAFRTNLRDLLGRVHRLVRVLKTQRRQTQLVRSTLASLKQLQEVA